MKEVKKIVEQRIEKHLNLVDETTDAINTIGTVTSPAVIESQTEDKKAASDKLPKVVSMIDKLAKRNIIHKKKAANLKSKLTKHVAAL